MTDIGCRCCSSLGSESRAFKEQILANAHFIAQHGHFPHLQFNRDDQDNLIGGFEVITSLGGRLGGADALRPTYTAMLTYTEQGTTTCIAYGVVSDHLANALPNLHFMTTKMVEDLIGKIHFKHMSTLVNGGMVNGDVLQPGGGSSAIATDGTNGA